MATTDVDDLHDLSPQDAQELNAFLEKRRWFEGKLKVLEALPPIYPFLHPALKLPSPIDDPLVPQYKSFNNNHSLPSEADIKSWQKERTALEEEILRFDGGDLSRMKQKTRAATLLPLTPPSTHLVSITLALIVIVDRLMKLLRHRAELLDLTAVRLDWDKLRWQIMLETTKVRVEIDSIAKDRGRWAPQGHESSKPSEVDVSHGQGQSSASLIPRSSTLASLSSVSSALSDIESTSHTPGKTSNTPRSKRDSISSLSSFVNSPKRNLHLPLLHSSIVNLEIREKNLTSTNLSRSGKLLDKMIDLAIPLKGLGGVSGPGEQAQEGGAVPDDLLDIQDDVESQVEELRRRVSWCKELEDQWKRADAHHSASTRALETAITLFDKITLAASTSARTELHSELENEFETARTMLPAPIGSDFPRPSHSAYPTHDRHSHQLVATLENRRNEAESNLRQCQEGLEWYARMATCSAAVTTQQSELGKLVEEMVLKAQWLDHGDEILCRPDLESVDLTTLTNDWADQAKGRIIDTNEIANRAMEAKQRLQLASMQYRKQARNLPPSLHQTEIDVSTAITDDAETFSDRAADGIAQARGTIKRAEHDIALIPIVLDALRFIQILKKEVQVLRLEIPSDNLSSGPTFDQSFFSRLEQMRQSFRRDVRGSQKAVSDLLQQQERSLPKMTSHLADASNGIHRDIEDLESAIRLLHAIHEQRQTVEAIEAEAEELLQRTLSMQQLVDQFVQCDGQGLTPSRVPEEIARITEGIDADIDADIDAWIGNLARRVHFVAGHTSEQPDDAVGASIDHTVPLLSPTSSLSRPPMTPPATPPATLRATTFSSQLSSASSVATDIDVRQADAETRRRVNESAVRVKGDLAFLRDSIDKAVSRVWGERLRRCNAQAQVSIDDCATSLHRYEDQLRDLLGVVDVVQQHEGLRAIAEEIDALSQERSATNLSAKLEGLTRSCEAEIVATKVLEEKDQEVLGTELSTLAQQQVVIVQLKNREISLDGSIEEVRLRVEAAMSQARQSTFAAQSMVTPEARDLPVTDVFGKVTEMPGKTTVDSLDADTTLASLGVRLAKLNLEALLYPSTSMLSSTLSLRQIPSSPVARRIKDELRAISEALIFIRGRDADSSDVEDDGIAAFELALSSAHDEMPRLEDLVAVNRTIQGCDEAISRLLDQLDQYEPSKVGEVRSKQDFASNAMVALRQAGSAVPDDSRVMSEIKRIESSWAEMEALVEETLNPDTASVASIDTVSDVSSIASKPTHAFRHPLARPATRNTSNPVVQARGLAEPRNRAASDTPTRMRVDSMKSGLPRLRKSSMGPGATFATPPAPNSKAGISSIPRPTRLSLASSTIDPMPTGNDAYHTAPRARTSSRPSLGGMSSSLPRPRKTYVADPKSKLDMAVGKIINKLNVNVPIRPVGMGVDNGDEWKDQSGKYWIGAEGRAKLCFCRILRSKTVMVRVGGGWVELSKFLMDHFADALSGWDPTSSGLAGIGIGSSTPIPITSASLATPLRPKAQSTIPTSTSKTPGALEATPRRNNHPASTPSRSIVTPRRDIASIDTQTTLSLSLSPTTPGPSTLSPMTNGNAGSPLVPLHFIRKASESPPVRQREKEKLGVGRRSILGRSPSGNVVSGDGSSEKQK